MVVVGEAGRAVTARARDALQARLEVPLVVRVLRLPRGGRVLELGCGRGVALEPLARLLRPSRLAGVDVDSRLLGEARGRVPAELVHADVRELPFGAAAFELVVEFGTVHRVDDPGRVLAEVARVLVPGGRFVHETRAAQALAHPLQATHRALPWAEAPGLVPDGAAVLWARRRKRG